MIFLAELAAMHREELSGYPCAFVDPVEGSGRSWLARCHSRKFIRLHRSWNRGSPVGARPPLASSQGRTTRTTSFSAQHFDAGVTEDFIEQRKEYLLLHPDIQ